MRRVCAGLRADLEGPESMGKQTSAGSGQGGREERMIHQRATVAEQNR